MPLVPHAAAYWPLFDLSVRTPTLELRYPDEATCVDLVGLAKKGIHDPGFMPFGFAWTDAESPDFERNSLKHYWTGRANVSHERWSLPFAVFADGEPIGMQDAMSVDFSNLRQAETGSWLGRDFQGKGFGKEMRAAIVHLLFEGLGALRCISGAWHDNQSSLGVSRSLGYVENGDEIRMRRDKPDRLIHLLLTREEWEPRRRDDIEIVGLEGCRDMLIASKGKTDS